MVQPLLKIIRTVGYKSYYFFILQADDKSVYAKNVGGELRRLMGKAREMIGDCIHGKTISGEFTIKFTNEYICIHLFLANLASFMHGEVVGNKNRRSNKGIEIS